jgi:hypothetical protein
MLYGAWQAMSHLLTFMNISDGSAIPPEDQATNEQVATLFDAMRIRVMAARMYQGLQIRMRQQFRMAVGNDNSKLSRDQRVVIAKLLNQYSSKAEGAYSIDDILADLTTIYQRYLTREDADAAIAYFSSRAGQDLLTAQPKIEGEAAPLVQQRAQKKGDVLTGELKGDLAAIKQQSAPSDTQPAKQ